jgi:ubiquinone/menaquinone biosynthesis C-methylase UbiE
MSYSLKHSRTPEKIQKRLSEVGLKLGEIVVDYGCGPGLYTIEIAKAIGPNGRVIAVDVHPLAANSINKLMKKQNLTNYSVIITDCDTKLSDHSVDVILLFDVYHLLTTPERNIREFHRILKSHGKLWVIVDHIDPKKVIQDIENTDCFKLIKFHEQTIEMETN